MNAHERRVFRRALDRVYPQGTLVQVATNTQIGFANARSLNLLVRVAMVRARTYRERAEYNRLMLVTPTKPFGYSSIAWVKVKPASPYVAQLYEAEMRAMQNPVKEM